MKKGLQYLFCCLAISLPFSLSALAEDGETPEIHAQGTILENEVSIEVEKDGITSTYTIGERVKSFHLRPDGSISAGATTRCDPVLGQLRSSLSLKVNITERYIQGDYDPDKGGWQRTPTGTTGEETLVFPAGSTLVGRCGSDSNELVAMSLHKPRN